MRLSVLLGERQKEKPADAFMDSHIFMLRGGYIRQVGGGIFSLLPPAKRAVNKIEEIIREEMDAVGGQEVLFPVVIPAELWMESGRYESVGGELARFKDRMGRPLVLGMTHEEASVHLARNEAKSYSRYPFMIYQIQTKFRDEPRARGGLIRVREFTMKDAYSFHTGQADLEEYYMKVFAAYERIYKRIGLGGVIAVQSDTGMMGGKKAHEFMFLSDDGEDTLILCKNPECGYLANMEVAVAGTSRAHGAGEAETPLTEVSTPDIKDIETLAGFLGVEQAKCVKAAVFEKEDGSPVIVFIRGDLAVNEAKLKRIIKAEIRPFAGNIPGLELGFVGPLNLSVKGAKIIYDASLKGLKNTVCGANKPDAHVTGLCVDRDLNIPEDAFVDAAKVNEGDLCPVCGQPLSLTRGIEVGNIFQLGDKYTKSMSMTYTDENGALQTPIMGCYGIGVGRSLACIIEAHHDERGPIWPKDVAPWRVHVCMLNADRQDIREAGEAIYAECEKRWDALIDDRNAAAGVQFADADLLGAPVRVILSKRNMDNGVAEVATRDKSIVRTVPVADVVAAVAEVMELI